MIEESEESWPVLRVFAFDHRSQMEEMEGATPEKIEQFKALCFSAALTVQDGKPGYGILCDGRYGSKVLNKASDNGFWIGRPIEWPGSRPLTLEPQAGPNAEGLSDWSANHVVKCLCFCHPDDTAEMWAEQEETVGRAFESAQRNGLEFLLEVISSKVGEVADDTTAQIIQKFYDAGIFPDWWKLEPFKTEAAWQKTTEAITRNDPNTNGIVVLGLDAPQDALEESLATAASQPLVKGFAVGRTIFGDTARAWMQGTISDEIAIQTMAARYQSLCKIWDRAKSEAKRIRSN